MKLLTKSELKEKIMSDRKVLVKAILALNEYQTCDEQVEQRAKYQNNVGFKSCHASKGSGMAQFFQKNGFLTENQMNWWLRGLYERPRILNYLNQLHRIHVKRYIQVTGNKDA